MGAVVHVLTALEKTTITKEVLESTRLGKHINKLRRQTTNDALAKRAKDLVRKWREMVLPCNNSMVQLPPPPPSPTLALQTWNGTEPPSPGTRVSSKPRSPTGTKHFAKPRSPFLRDGTPLKVPTSPAPSLNSDQSCSPNPTPTNEPPNPPISQNHGSNQTKSPILSCTSQNHHELDAVPRTHSSNKRLRKDDVSGTQYDSSLCSSPSCSSCASCSCVSTRDESNSMKKQRTNGENMNININTNSQVPSPSITMNSTFVVPKNHDSNDPHNMNTGPKKRGRKKGSKSLKNQELQQDRVKEKLASISRNPKLRTTQELLADLQARGSGGGGGGGGSITCPGTINTRIINKEPPRTEEILKGPDDIEYSRNNRKKWINSTTRVNDGIPMEMSRNIQNFNENENIHEGRYDPTVEEILAKLPRLDPDLIQWSDHDDVHDHDSINSCKHIEITDQDIDRLHNECIEGLNGNFQLKLRNDTNKNIPDVKRIPGISSTCRVHEHHDREFREWHEMLARPSYDGQILHILPYVIMD